MTNEKMTNSKAIAFVLENCEVPTEVAEKLANIKASIDKKNARGTGERKPSAKQLENARLAETIREFMVGKPAMSVTEIINAMPELSGLSTQKVTPLLKEGFTSEKVKGVNRYSLAE